MTGYQYLAGEFRVAFDGADPWGSSMGWFFAVAETLWHRSAADIPAEWQFGHGMGCDGSSDDYPDAVVMEMYDSGQVSDADLVRFGNVLSRYTDLLRAAELDY